MPEIPRYRMTERLGEGGMGAVYLAESDGGWKHVVKVIRADHVRDPYYRQRFLKEARAAQKVSGAYTASVVDFGEYRNQLWLAMEYVPGKPLREVVNVKSLSEPDLRLLTRQLAEGLRAIHRAGIVHRDLTPRNIMIHEHDGMPRIIDFGLAYDRDEATLGESRLRAGTRGYKSPEQVRGEAAGPPSDVFTLGVTLAFAGTGKLPFEHDDEDGMPLGEPDLDGLPASLRPVIARCLDMDPGRRPTPSGIIKELATTALPGDVITDADADPDATAKGDSAAPGSPSTRPGRDRPPWAIAVPAVAVIAAAVAVAVAWPLGHPSAAPSHRAAATSPAGASPAAGATVPGPKTTSMPVASLPSAVRARFALGTKKVTSAVGYEFQSSRNPGLCLTADTGPQAGRQGDPVVLSACGLAADQVWIPDDWEGQGQSFTHLVNDAYRGLCLNARKIDGTADRPGRAIMLWPCFYASANETWQFQDWQQTVASEHHAYPLCLDNAPDLCVDTGEHPGFPPGIRLWNKRAGADQSWS